MFGRDPQSKSTFFLQDGCRRALAGEKVMFATVEPKYMIERLKDHLPWNVLFEITFIGDNCYGIVPHVRRGK